MRLVLAGIYLQLWIPYRLYLIPTGTEVVIETTESALTFRALSQNQVHAV